MTDRYITMSLLGRYGRLGNQLFQYAFLRIAARKCGAILQTAPWVGEYLFGLPPSPVTVNLPALQEAYSSGSCPVPLSEEAVCGHDFRGYGQFHTSFYAPHRDFICGLFKPVEEVCTRIRGPLEKFFAAGTTRIGIHLRRGDYGRLEFYITPVQWYLDWLAAHWHKFDNPVLFVATESRELIEQFAAYEPVTAESLGVDLQCRPRPHYHYLGEELRRSEPWQLDFFPDWYLLTQCEILLVPNSSFSFTAAMLAPNLRELWRSHLPTQAFEAIEPWNAMPLEQDRAEDYKHVPGVCLDSNPYW